ncbi:hypothetical protein CRM22_010552 [Opisthorchis felineus]|uniref:Uncharacterized protein n=1 Tax=Opisthorchis felineus TaxID=147828 RepID=A0A4S2KXL6_OPIFE|nr:hypothetical protein CRM22_010552 [Opisthorchis felineus]
MTETRFGNVNGAVMMVVIMMMMVMMMMTMLMVMMMMMMIMKRKRTKGEVRFLRFASLVMDMSTNIVAACTSSCHWWWKLPSSEVNFKAVDNIKDQVPEYFAGGLICFQPQNDYSLRIMWYSFSTNLRLVSIEDTAHVKMASNWVKVCFKINAHTCIHVHRGCIVTGQNCPSKQYSQ